MRVLGLDLGSVTCGVAVSDPLKIVARSVETIRFPAEENDIAVDRIKQLCKELDVDTIVLGLPKHMNNDIGIRAQIALEFKDKLEDALNIKVVMVDERLTTVISNNIMIKADMSRKKRKKKVDSIAASLILQSYLDRRI